MISLLKGFVHTLGLLSLSWHIVWRYTWADFKYRLCPDAAKYGSNCCSAYRLISHYCVRSALMTVFSICIISKGCCGILLKIFFSNSWLIVVSSSSSHTVATVTFPAVRPSNIPRNSVMCSWSSEEDLLPEVDDSSVSLCESTSISYDITYCVFLDHLAPHWCHGKILFLGLQLATEYQIHLMPGVHKAQALPRNVP